MIKGLGNDQCDRVLSIELVGPKIKGFQISTDCGKLTTLMPWGASHFTEMLTLQGIPMTSKKLLLMQQSQIPSP